MNDTLNTPVRGFFFWSLSPPLLIFIIAMPFLIQKHDTPALLTLIALELEATLLLIGLFNPIRFWLAFRGVGLGIFLAYLTYLIVSLQESGGTIRIPKNRAESSPFNAICGLIVFGLPGLWYAILGRLTWRREDQVPFDGRFDIDA